MSRPLREQPAPTLSARLFVQLEQARPAGYARWNGPLLTRALGEADANRIWAESRALGISLERRRSWGVATDPQFATKAAAVVGLHLAPPCNAVGLSVDERPCIQALERAQGCAASAHRPRAWRPL
jgi:hypothetical protein